VESGEVLRSINSQIKTTKIEQVRKLHILAMKRSRLLSGCVLSTSAQILSLVPLHLCLVSIINLNLSTQIPLAKALGLWSSPANYQKPRERLKINPFSSFRLNLNRIFAELDEVSEDDEGGFTLQLPFEDERAKHISNILKLRTGDRIKTGVLDVGIYDHGVVLKPSAKESSTGPLIYMGHRSELYRAPVPRIDLMLAVPRPLRLGRILTTVAMMGVGCIVLTDAAKVEVSI